MNPEKLLEKIPGELDGVLITSPENRRYFTGFASSDGALIAARGGSVFLTDSRYIEAACKRVACCPVELTRELMKELPELMERLGIRRLGVEARRITLAQYEKLTAALPGVCVTAGEAVDRAIASLRMVKSPEERDAVLAAQRIAERAFEHILGFIKPGVSERDIALELDFFMLKNGAEALSFETIAVSGENSSMPHGVPGDRKVESGDFITMDYGAVIDGYHSDMTRTVALGGVSPEQRRVYATVLAAQEAALDRLCAGIGCAQADAAAREIITKAGYGQFFGHGTGHGVGIEIHEEPRLAPSSRDILEPGNLVTVEPGIYLPGRFGVRIEDMALITETSSENLTCAPKELIIL